MRTHQHDRRARRERIRSIIWGAISIVLGWSAFVFCWVRVLQDRQDFEVLSRLLATIIVLCDAVVVASIGWIIHNRRLAQRDKRRSASTYIPPAYLRDTAERALVFPDLAELRDAPVIIVTATRKRKIFSPIAGAKR